MDETVQTHITALETAYANAHAFVDAMPDGDLKTSANAHLTASHDKALEELQAFAAENPGEIAQLRGGGTDK